MREDKIVHCLAGLRQDAGEGHPLEAKAGNRALHGVQNGIWRIEPVQAIDEARRLPAQMSWLFLSLIPAKPAS
jgi:hypothetical protein